MVIFCLLNFTCRRKDTSEQVIGSLKEVVVLQLLEN